MRRSPSSSSDKAGGQRSKASKQPRPPTNKQPKQPAKQSLVYELSAAFFELLLKHRTYYTSAVADEKIPPMQGHALHFLAERPYTMRELAKAAMLEPSNLTGIIDKLEARDLVTRREASGDRRSKIVTITEEGLALRNRLYQRFSEPAPWMMALSPQDQKRLLDIVRSAIAYEKAVQAPSGKTPRPAAEVDAPRSARSAPVVEPQSPVKSPPKIVKDQGKRTRK